MSMVDATYVLSGDWNIVRINVFFYWKLLWPDLDIKYVFPLSTTRVTVIVDGVDYCVYNKGSFDVDE